MEHLRTILEARQIRIYFLAIGCGGLWGLTAHSEVALAAAITPALAVMLFATFLQVPIATLGTALRNLRFMCALLFTNFVALPLVAAGLVQFLPADPLLRLAVLLVLFTPCIDYVITFTHLSGGNARLLLAATPVLLLLQIALLPVFLSLVLGEEAAQVMTASSFLQAFLWLIVVPLLAAAVVQMLERRQRLHQPAAAALNLLPVPATAVVLFLVLATVTPQIGLAYESALRALPIYVVYALLAPFVGLLMGRSLRLDAATQRAVAFSASYRNSLVLLPLALMVPGGIPLVPAVILTQTMVELCFMPLYVRMIPRLTRTDAVNGTGATAPYMRHPRGDSCPK